MKKLNLITEKKSENIHEKDIAVGYFDCIDAKKLDANSGGFISLRVGGNFSKKAIRLADCFDYKLGTDNEGEIILVPLKK